MRLAAAWIALLAMACGSTRGAPPVDASKSAQDWARRCSARIEAARQATAPSAPGIERGAIRIDPSPWHPSIRFEAHAGSGYFEAAVSHGRDACDDYDSDEPSFTNLRWSDAAHGPHVALDRIRRMGGDEAWVQADRVPQQAIEPFRSAFEQALEACLVDARTVPLGKVPADYSCIDKADRCPDKPDQASIDDGCPPAR